MLRRALTTAFDGRRVEVAADGLAKMAPVADGDARRALNLLELAVGLAEADVNGRRYGRDRRPKNVIDEACAGSIQEVRPAG